MAQTFFHKRIIFDAVLFALIFMCPYWLTAFIAFLGLIFIPFYIEFIVALFCVESLYRGSAPLFVGVMTTTSPWSSLLLWGMSIFVFVEVLRTLIREHTRAS